MNNLRGAKIIYQESKATQPSHLYFLQKDANYYDIIVTSESGAKRKFSLSNYYTKNETDLILENYYLKSEIDTFNSNTYIYINQKISDLDGQIQTQFLDYYDKIAIDALLNSSYYKKSETYSQNEVDDLLDDKQDVIAYTPENVSNKSDSYIASSSTTYASTKALVDGLATKLDKGNYTGTAQDLKSLIDTKADLVSGKVPKSQSQPSTMVMNNSTYVITFTDATGVVQAIDLPLESLFQDANYDETTKSLIVTLQDGTTRTIPLSDLVDLPEIVLSTANPAVTPTTGQKVYFNTSLGKVWFNVGGNWVFGGNLISDSEKDNLTTAYDHSQTTGNPHGTTKSDIGLGNVPNLDTTNAVNNSHTHSNKSILDLITEPFTTSLKSLYDGVVTSINNLLLTGQRLITSGEITKLSNTSGTNTGDETTSSIQTKRPLKTIEGQSLEGSGNIDLTKNDIGLGNVDNTSDLNKPISTATQQALNNKLDKGAYTGTAQDLKNDIDGIQIGGRNLMLYSKGEFDYYVPITTTEPLKVGDEYTLSFDVIGNANGNIFINNSISSGYDTSGTGWRRKNVTFTFIKNDYGGHEIFPHIYGADSVKNVKLEKGNKATDWTPAPEDKQDRLQDITGNVGVGKTDASATEKLDVNGNIKATSFIKSGGTANQALRADGGVFDLNSKADLVGGKVPSSQLPSYVDDVLEFTNLASFPATGESGKIYIATDTNRSYRWSGSAYTLIVTGNVDSVNGKTGVAVITKADVGLGNVANVDTSNPANITWTASYRTVTDTEKTTWNGKASTTVVTTSANGLMSSTDKTKLDGIATGANNYTHPTGDGNSHVPATGTTNNGKVLKAGATANSASWGNVDWSEIANKPTTFTPTAHNHAISEVTNLQTSLDAKVNTSDVVTTATADKILKLDGSAKLPASITGNADGNAATATKLQTPRKINGVSFDGSADITINAVDSIARIASSEKGAINGVATLDSTGKVPATQSQPSTMVMNNSTYVITFTDATGTVQTIDLPLESLFQDANYDETTKSLIVTLQDGTTRTIPLSDLVDLPEIVLSTANPAVTPTTGQKVYFNTSLGKVWFNVGGNWVFGGNLISDIEKDNLTTAYTHSQATGNPHGTTKNDIGLGNVDNTSDLNKPISTATQQALNNKLDKGAYTGTAQDLKNDIDGIQIGGRNLLKKSSVEKSNGMGWITWELTEKIQGTYTVQFWIENTIENIAGLGFGNANGYDGVYLEVTNIQNGIYTRTFTNLNSGNNTHLTLWVNNTTVIKKAKLERGNKATDWTPAPEDKQDSLQDITGNVGVGKTDASATEKLDVNGNIKATGFKTSTGTPSQFLKADGSVDSNTYALATGTNATSNWSNTSSGLSINPTVTGKTLNASGQTVTLRDATYGQISGIVQDDTGSPLASQWSNRLKTLHNNAQGYFTELAQSFTGTEGVWHRRNVAGTISSWKQLYDDSIWNAATLSYSGSTLTLTINGIQKTTTINAGTTYTAGTNISISGNQISVVDSPTFSGNVTASGFYESSLRRLKENILPFELSGLCLLSQLEIVTYDRIDKSSLNKIGIIADDSPEEFLSEDKDAVDLYKTVFIQAKAIQELKSEVDELKEELNNLRELVMSNINK